MFVINGVKKGVKLAHVNGQGKGLKCWLNGLKIGVKLAPLYGLKCWLNFMALNVV